MFPIKWYWSVNVCIFFAQTLNVAIGYAIWYTHLDMTNSILCKIYIMRKVYDNNESTINKIHIHEFATKYLPRHRNDHYHCLWLTLQEFPSKNHNAIDYPLYDKLYEYSIILYNNQSGLCVAINEKISFAKNPHE